MRFFDLPREVRKNRLISLAFGSPYLLFTVPGILTAMGQLPERDAALFLLIEIPFITAYLSVWLTLDVPCPTQHLSRRHLALYSVLVTLFLFSLSITSWGTIFNSLYLMSAAYFTVPRRYVPRSFVAAICLIAGTALVGWWASIPRDTFTAYLVAAPIALLMFALVRHTLDEAAEQENQFIADKAAAVETERARMAGNLHDRLGQTLTAINTVAQVSTRLARAGKLEEAAERSEQIAELASQALREVRQVVRSDDRLTIAEEVARAKMMLEAADITLHLTVTTTELPAEVEDAFAHVIREGCANIVHHSLTSSAVIRVTNDRVEIIDSGPA
ncbi:MAG: histidine kinase, partial [Flaviflexus sp.]|nr:histidine kinase [Flaviflexus sp.]